MTAIIERMPLQPLPMSQTQRQSRRLSARLQEKDGSHSEPREPAREAQTSKTNAKKRKTVYEEDDDGFAFSRVKKKKSKEAPKPAPIPEEEHAGKDAPRERKTRQPAEPEPAETARQDVGAEPAKKRQKKKMSFSTPDVAEKQPVRRSKRLSEEDRPRSPQHRTRRKADDQRPPVANDDARSKEPSPLRVPKARKAEKPQTQDESQPARQDQESSHERHSATKIALPFADTPVIKRNKEMRENKGKKGERRSSLSMRGRRASSLIDSGNSNALPHDEVEIADFYKHIESEGLPEPRRMRQLLTWCTTRSLDQKPMGAGFEEASAIAAARVIEDELLKDLANKSELSDWFSREDSTIAPKELPERPNPRNIQNTGRIAELEAQIQRLKLEKDALEQLLRPPASLKVPKPTAIDPSLLSPEEALVFEQLQTTTSTSNVKSRLDSIFDRIQPTVDSFADSVHKIAQYQKAGDNVASRVLSIAAEKLAEREDESRRRAQPQDAPRSPRTDLGSVLRGLSRADQ